MLFDTANEVAQIFKNGFIAKYAEAPDWVAAHSYDSAHIIVETIKDLIRNKESEETEGDGRAAIRAGLAWRTQIEDAITGVTGPIYFDESGEAQKPVFVGVYNGADIISALTQLQPIKIAGAQNYIEELKKGRVLYVNDRFMYKTNVVYTGVQINEVAELDRELNEYLLDFAIWFLYRGDFNPQDIEFVNAAEPIVLGDAIDENQLGDLKYRLYRVQGKFQFNFSDTKREYGHHLVGVAFTHDELNKNNLQYVVDVLGVGLNTGETYQDKLNKIEPLDPASGWIVDRAWISQDIVGHGTMGNPDYVGFSASEPDFSEISIGIIVKRAEINVKDFIPSDWFIYIGIFALIGSVFAVGMDSRDRGRFWTVQSWFLRVVSWPFLLLSTGNLLLDFAVQNLPDHYIGIITLTYSTLWWIVPTRLVGMAVQRFLWVPLEDHTERTIPNVIRVFVSVALYSFAACGIVAFVMDQTLTSILASTGLLAMIVGLAVQSNISNIFSGIVINMERPFNVGDWVKIGDLDEGRVVDITWRTVRVKVRNGYVLSLPNGQVAEAQVHNYSSFDCVRLEVPFLLDVKYPFMETSDIMEQGLAKAAGIVDMPPREVRFKGAHWNFAWIAEYEIQFWIDQYGRKEEIAEAAMICIWDELNAHGIDLQVPNSPDGERVTVSLPPPDGEIVPEPA